MKIPIELNVVENEDGEETIFLNFWNSINGNDVNVEFIVESDPQLYDKYNNNEFMTLQEFIEKVKLSYLTSKL